MLVCAGPKHPRPAGGGKAAVLHAGLSAGGRGTGVRAAACSELIFVLQASDSAWLAGMLQVVRAACLRTRDRDAAVRQEAYAFLLLLPPASLESGLGLADWRCLLDVALLPSGDSGRGGQADKHVAAVRAAGKQLLQQFLTQGEQGRRGWLARLQALMGPAFLGGCGSGAALRAAYAAALHDVLTPADVLEAAAMLYGS